MVLLQCFRTFALPFFLGVAEVVLFGGIFIAVCAAGMCWQTRLLPGLGVGDVRLYLLVFGATLAAYNLHYLAGVLQGGRDSRRRRWGERHLCWHGVLLVAGAGCACWGLPTLTRDDWPVAMVLGGLTLAYSFPMFAVRLNALGAVKLPVLTLVWMLVTVWLPLSDAAVLPGVMAWMLAQRFVFVGILALAFDIRDIDHDTRRGVRTWAVWLGRRRAWRWARGGVVMYAALAFSGGWLLGSFSGVTALLLSGVIVWYALRWTEQNGSEYLFLAGMDGMLLVQSLLVGWMA